MSTSVETPVRSRDPHETIVKSYRYLRTALVGLLVGLGVAVFFQSWRDGQILSSVSAYYYTPAQAIFVGALIAVGACMIALKGTTELEDVLLNLGGMAAVVVAVVPTSRGEDYETAVRACRTAESIPGPDCPTVRALEQATRANVENNMVALLVVGGLSLLVALAFARRGRPRTDLDPAGYAAAVAVVLAAAVSFLWFRERFISSAHYVAAGLLFLFILAVVVENARRYERERDSSTTTRRPAPYVVVAWTMLIGTGIALLLWRGDVISLFVLEIVVAGLFAVFWAVQTVEQSGTSG